MAPLERLAPELQRAGDEFRDVELRLRETASELHAFLASLEADPGRLEELEADLDRIAETKRRFRCATYDELLARREEARAELAALEDGSDPGRGRGARARGGRGDVSTRLRSSCGPSETPAAPAFADAVAAELRGVGMGEGEFVCELRERDEPGSTGGDEAVFLVRPNAGLPFAPVAETASGGELSRIALAIAAVAGGDTLVFDEIDAGIGGETAHAVGATAPAARRACPGRDDHAPPTDRRPRRPPLPGREDFRRSRPTRGSSSSATRSGKPSSSGCWADRSSLPQYADRHQPQRLLP